MLRRDEIGVQLATIKTKTTANAKWLQDYIVTSQGFPAAGMTLQWYGPLLRNPKAFDRVIKELASRYKGKKIDALLGIEARGFIVGAALAHEMGVPFVLVRKLGKLPGEVITVKYERENGPYSLEIEGIALKKGDNVIIVDDLLATGGTVLAACHLVEKLGAHVLEVACVIELLKLGGRDKIPYPVFSLLAMDENKSVRRNSPSQQPVQVSVN